MSVPYKNPISSVQISTPQSVARSSVFGTNFSILNVGGYMEVYNLSDLSLTLTASSYPSLIQLSANTIPIRFTKGNNTFLSPDYLTLNSDNISSGRRRLGMLVYVHETDLVYQYVIPNYDTLWNNLSGLTGFSSVTYSDYTTVINTRSSAGQSFISGWTSSNIEGVGGYTSANANWRIFQSGSSSGGTVSGDYLPLSGGTVSGATIFSGGLTSTTISATTYLNLPSSTFTGGTVTGPTIFTNGLTANTISATTYLNLPTDIRVTGATYSNNTFTYINNTGGTFSVLFNTVTGLTANTLTVTGNTSLQGLTATTISATTYQNLPTDIRVTGATYSNNTFTYTNNTGGTFNVLFNTVTGLTVNGNLTVTGNTNVRAFTGTSGVISGTGQNILTVIGSGNSTTSPIFSVLGSNGELFSVSDSLIGSLFSVNDISGLPIVEVFSDSTILMGNYLAPSLNTTVRLSLTAGTNTIYSLPTSAYTGAFVDYTVINSGNTSARAGNIMSIWTTGSTEFTDVSTNDIGSTSGITFSSVLSGTSVLIRASATTTGWVLKTIIRSI
jgi:hypothetical protein